MHSIDTSSSHLVAAAYDRYARMLFPILIDICHSREHAEKVLEMTFLELASHESITHGKSLSFISLVRIVLANARRQGCTKNKFSIRAFQHCPILHQLIVSEDGPDATCNQLGLARTELAKQLRHEMNSTSSKQHSQAHL